MSCPTHQRQSWRLPLGHLTPSPCSQPSLRQPVLLSACYGSGSGSKGVMTSKTSPHSCVQRAHNLVRTPHSSFNPHNQHKRFGRDMGFEEVMVSQGRYQGSRSSPSVQAPHLTQLYPQLRAPGLHRALLFGCLFTQWVQIGFHAVSSRPRCPGAAYRFLPSAAEILSSPVAFLKVQRTLLCC